MHVQARSYEALIDCASQQLRLLREAVMQHDLCGVEFHTKVVQEMLLDLEPILRRQAHHAVPLRSLREATISCIALIGHMRSTARALSALYHSFPRDGVRY